jgi:membrane protein implicated in regulation of membrane protease activity
MMVTMFEWIAIHFSVIVGMSSAALLAAIVVFVSLALTLLLERWARKRSRRSARRSRHHRQIGPVTQ